MLHLQSKDGASCCKKLRRHPLSWVNFPDEGKMEEFAAMVEDGEPLVDIE